MVVVLAVGAGAGHPQRLRRARRFERVGAECGLGRVVEAVAVGVGVAEVADPVAVDVAPAEVRDRRAVVVPVGQPVAVAVDAIGVGAVDETVTVVVDAVATTGAVADELGRTRLVVGVGADRNLEWVERAVPVRVGRAPRAKIGLLERRGAGTQQRLERRVGEDVDLGRGRRATPVRENVRWSPESLVECNESA